ncbi:MAG: Hpt domain-containing protein [Oceanospirillaceae bacterium]|nr:Hpt domain-containing protein [Oceanospirillaceae bacterium]
MSLDADEEILQDFLVEAGEILELLSEQLVDLEQRPNDVDLLNAIFRGFHTVKGGAGFLQLTPLVECCHVAENVFDLLRNGQRSVNAELMDVVLKALDTVNEMFDSVRGGVMPEPASEELMHALKLLSVPESQDAPAPAETAPEPVAEAPAPEPQATAEAGAEGDISDAEFEQLMDALDGDAPAETPAAQESAAPVAAEDPFADTTPAAAPAGSDDEITDDEFEALLDQLHGKGKGLRLLLPAQCAGPHNSCSTICRRGRCCWQPLSLAVMKPFRIRFEELLDECSRANPAILLLNQAPKTTAPAAEPAKPTQRQTCACRR